MEQNIRNAVNRFKMTGVEVAESSGGYEVSISWEAITCYPPCDQYWVWVFRKNEVFQKEAISALSNFGKIILQSIDLTAEYTLGLSDEEDIYDEDKCKKEKLLFSPYTNLSGSYDGSELLLHFCGPSEDLSKGTCHVLWGTEEKAYPGLKWQLESGETLRRLSIDWECFGENTSFVLELIPEISDISKGPAARSRYFYTGLPKVRYAAAADGKLTTSLSWAYEGREELQIQAVLLQNGRLFYRSTWAAFIRTEEETTVSWEIEDAGVLELAGKSELYLRLNQEGKYVSWDALKEKVSLQLPTITQLQAVNGSMKVAWEYEGPGGTVFEVQRGTESIRTAERSCHFALTQLADLDVVISVRSVRGEYKSAFSPAKSGFIPGYYPGSQDNAMIFCARKYQETEVKIEVGSELFSESLKETLTAGPLSISVEGVLTIGKEPLDGIVYTQWLKLLEIHKLTTEGYYQMHRLVSAYASMNPETVLAVYAGVCKEKRLSMLVPGMLLMVAPGEYSWQTSQGASANGGMVQGTPMYFPIGLKNKMLSFDSYFDLMCPKWELGNQTSEKRIIYGGVMDWFRKEIRKPYLGLWVPQAFRDSGEEPSYDPSDNLVLLAGNTREEVETAAEQLSKNPTKPLAINHIICRNRSFLTPVVRIWINGNPRYIPVGSSLRDVLPFLEMSAIPEMSKKGLMEMKRMTPKGYEKVHLSWFAGETAMEIPLLYEDWIQVYG